MITRIPASGLRKLSSGVSVTLRPSVNDTQVVVSLADQCGYLLYEFTLSKAGRMRFSRHLEQHGSQLLLTGCGFRQFRYTRLAGTRSRLFPNLLGTRHFCLSISLSSELLQRLAQEVVNR